MGHLPVHWEIGLLVGAPVAAAAGTMLLEHRHPRGAVLWGGLGSATGFATAVWMVLQVGMAQTCGTSTAQWDWFDLPGVWVHATWAVDRLGAWLLAGMGLLGVLVHVDAATGDRGGSRPLSGLETLQLAWLGLVLAAVSRGYVLLLLGWGLGSLAVSLHPVTSPRSRRRTERMFALDRAADVAVLAGAAALTGGTAGATTGGWPGPGGPVSTSGAVLILLAGLMRMAQFPWNWRWQGAWDRSGGTGLLVQQVLPAAVGMLLVVRSREALAALPGGQWVLAGTGLVTLLGAGAIALACGTAGRAVEAAMAMHTGMAMVAVALGQVAVGALQVVGMELGLVALVLLGGRPSQGRGPANGLERVAGGVTAVLTSVGLPAACAWILVVRRGEALDPWAALAGLVAGIALFGLVGGHLVRLVGESPGRARRRAKAGGDAAGLSGSMWRVGVFVGGVLGLVAVAATSGGDGSIWRAAGKALAPVPLGGRLPAQAVWVSAGGLALLSCVGGWFVGRGEQQVRLSGVQDIVARGLYCETAFDWIVLQPLRRLGELLRLWVEDVGLQVLVMTGAGVLLRAAGWTLSRMHSGRTRDDALMILGGTAVVVMYFFLTG